ncbi:MAG: NADH-quinone oxidoreductase subunit C [Thermoproteota archaeon]
MSQSQPSRLEEALKPYALSFEARENYTAVVVRPEAIRESVKTLMGLGYDYLLSISGVDLPKEDKIKVVYHFTRSSDPRSLVALEVHLPRSNPVVDSIHDIVPAAYYQEREEHEMLGIEFRGHPDKRHLLLPEDWPEGTYPLRKDFKVPDEPTVSKKQSKPIWELKPELKPKEDAKKEGEGGS